MSTPIRQIRILYDSSKCIGNQSCVKQDPQTFRFDANQKKAILVGGREVDSFFKVDMAGDEPLVQQTIRAAASCPVNAFTIEDLDSHDILVGNKIDSGQSDAIQARYDDSQNFVLDPAGYFLIRVNYSQGTIEAGFCAAKNTVLFTVSGKKPIDIYHTVAQKQGLNLRKEHYAYLGRELEKAYHCLMTGMEYVQDDELHAMKPRAKKMV